jgi:hypothetical protein
VLWSVDADIEVFSCSELGLSLFKNDLNVQGAFELQQGFSHSRGQGVLQQGFVHSKGQEDSSALASVQQALEQSVGQDVSLQELLQLSSS